MKKLQKKFACFLLAALFLGSIVALTWISKYSEVYKVALGFAFHSQELRKELGKIEYAILIGASSSTYSAFQKGKPYTRKCASYRVMLRTEQGIDSVEIMLQSESTRGGQWELIGITGWHEPSPPCRPSEAV